MILFDTHAHYDDERFDPDRDAVLTSLKSEGVEHVVNPGCDIASSLKAASYADKYPFMYFSAGIHPHEARNAEEGYLNMLRNLLKRPKCVAVGEIGLDYHYDFSPRDVQKRICREQMSLASELNMPVIFHDREAHEDSLNMVKEFPNLRGVFHCYSGSAETAAELIKRGWIIGFTGSVTFKNAHNLQAVASYIPLERIIIETDAPYMTPHPRRGERNDSRLLYLVADKLADLHGITADEVARITTKNALDFYRL